MHQVPIQTEAVKWSNENVIDLIRKVRNDLIKDFLDERFLKEYLATQYNIRELPLIKIEFIKSNLKELLISPVNTHYYGSIIKRIKETDSASLTEGNEMLFYKEIETILKKYLY